jgi:CDP-diacylglycerol--glycerol-3-phosphate 3-phosphatidyltransferase
MNLPNALTLLRIFFVPLLVAVLVQEDLGLNLPYPFYKEFAALGIFLAAAATDLLDGYLARRWHQVTTVGMLLDPIADKLLISAALVSLVQIRMVPGWMAILIIGREFAVTGLRSIAASEQITIAASDIGKTKMVAQVTAISMVMLGIHVPVWRPWAGAAMWLVVLFGMVSAIDYFLKFWRGIDEGIKLRSRTESLVLERQQKLEEARRRRQARLAARAAKSASSSSTTLS